ncbi:primosomal protein N' [Corynebacterium sp.]|uniref:primosomal protein N' n=1 Tax=Corynebacterium sp. TaxID=1720 RepID=UPI002648A0F2|nr:primosomal protein N' [Corynebacterium sp.]MDN6136361.1 primosomal protein N' [Corynebacterium sp.]MDN6737372.1 primosomal protein N' [Corynebacterium sp.]
MPKKIPATTKPVVRVLPLLGVSHLDRLFDYQIAEEDSEAAQPGVRVRIRFNGRLVDALLIQRLSESDFEGRLAFIDRVISPFPVYPPQLASLVDALANRYGGTRSDIIRFAIPPRHAKAEEADLETTFEELGEIAEPDLSSWSAYQFGESFVDFVLEGNTARAAWQVAPGDDWAAAIAALGTKVAKSGRGVLVVVPDQSDVDVVESAFRKYVSAKQATVLNVSQGPQARYRRYLSVLVGQARIVIGTKSAAFAPVKALGLAVIFNDGDDNLVERSAPYVHSREVLTTRSAQENASLLIVGHSRTAETQLLVSSGWAHDLVAAESTLRTRMPSMVAVGPYGLNFSRNLASGTTSFDGRAYQAVKSALDRGEPVLVQSPRKGYVPTLACAKCFTRARCRHCNGPLSLPHSHEQAATPSCAWCGKLETRFKCSECGSNRLRAVVMGSERTAEELGRIFPNTRIIVSGGNKVVETVPMAPALVVATPGAEPRVEDAGETESYYGAALLLGAGALLNRQDLRAGEDALAKWLAAAMMVAPSSKGGTVVISANAGVPIIDAFLGWDVVGFAKTELAARREVRFPPAVHMAAIDGADAALDDFLEAAKLPEHAEILGPVPLPENLSLPGEYDTKRFGPAQRLLIRTPLGPRSELGKALRAANSNRSARKDDLPLRIQVDPINIG